MLREADVTRQVLPSVFEKLGASDCPLIQRRGHSLQTLPDGQSHIFLQSEDAGVIFGSVSVTQVMCVGAPVEAERLPSRWLGGAVRCGDAVAGSGVLCSLQHCPAAMLRPGLGVNAPAASECLASLPRLLPAAGQRLEGIFRISLIIFRSIRWCPSVSVLGCFSSTGGNLREPQTAVF